MKRINYRVRYCGVSSGCCCTHTLNLGWKNKGEGVSKGKLLIRLVVVKRLKWGVLKMSDSQEAGLGKDGVDWGINKEGDESLIGERYRKEREQLILSPRMCEKIECVETDHEEITDWMRRISDSRRQGSCARRWLRRNIYFKWKEEISRWRRGEMNLIHVAWLFHRVRW